MTRRRRFSWRGAPEAHIPSYSRHGCTRRRRPADNPCMDEIVLRAMQKWPSVPSVYGWLAVDRRGNWSIKGERIVNPVITGFIGRNYAADERGRWYFQNGPQKVFVTLAYAPFVLRTQRDPSGMLGLTAHTGATVVDPREALLD